MGAQQHQETHMDLVHLDHLTAQQVLEHLMAQQHQEILMAQELPALHMDLTDQACLMDPTDLARLTDLEDLARLMDPTDQACLMDLEDQARLMDPQPLAPQKALQHQEAPMDPQHLEKPLLQRRQALLLSLIREESALRQSDLAWTFPLAADTDHVVELEEPEDSEVIPMVPHLNLQAWDPLVMAVLLVILSMAAADDVTGELPGTRHDHWTCR